jgi:hypothetical protein
MFIPQEQDGPVQSESESQKPKSRYDRRSDSMPCCLVHAALEGLHPNEFKSDIRGLY